MVQVMSYPQAHEVIQAQLLEELIEIYLDHLESSGAVSRQTVVNYRIHLRPFQEYWRLHAPAHNYLLTREVLQEAYVWIRKEYRNQHGRPPAYTTVQDCFNRLHSCLNWLYKSNCTGTVNASDWCPRLRKVPNPQYFPTLGEMERLIRAPSGPHRLRDTALMAFLLATGARRLETAHVLTRDVTFLTPASDLILGHDHRGHCWLRRVKGDRDELGAGRYVVFGTEAGLLLKAYIRSADRQPDDHLFGLSDSGIGQVIERHTSAIGLPEISPHAFRRAFAEYWDDHYRRGNRILLKLQLGHSLKGGDVTEDHYINQANYRRVIRDLLAHYVSPLQSIHLDWTAYPVTILEEPVGMAA